MLEYIIQFISIMAAIRKAISHVIVKNGKYIN